MTSRTLLILAAPPAVGKTTILVKALKHRAPLFGPAFDSQFQLTRLPPRWPERNVPRKELINVGAWVNEDQFCGLAFDNALPDSVVVHVDLYALGFVMDHYCTLLEGGHIPGKGSADTIGMEVRNAAVFGAFLNLACVRRFDRLAVNTLYVPFDVARNQWNKRQEQERPSKTIQYFHDVQDNIYPTTQDDATYLSLYRDWTACVSKIKPEAHYFSEVQNNGIAMKNTHGVPDFRFPWQLDMSSSG